MVNSSLLKVNLHQINIATSKNVTNDVIYYAYGILIPTIVASD